MRFDFWEGGVLGVPNLGGTVIVSDNGGTLQRPAACDVPNGENA